MSIVATPVALPSTVNVLIVDDDRATQRMLADALTKQGFTVTVERDGEWAVKTFEKKSFDAVLLDLLLPALNGYEVARKMRQLPKGKRTPIIMISGVYKNALHQKEAVQKHGAFAFLEKPMRLSSLYDTLRQALGEKYPKPRAPEPPPPPVEDDPATGEHLADREALAERDLVENTAEIMIPKEALESKPPPPPPPSAPDSQDAPTQSALPQLDAPPTESRIPALIAKAQKQQAKPPPPPPDSPPAPAPRRREEPPTNKLPQKPPPPPKEMGDFEQRPFAEVVASLHRARASGALLVRREKAKKIIYFRDGIPQSVKSNLLSECLGRVMVREKIISEAECEESLKKVKSSGRMQGTVLIEMGCISPHNLQYALQMQLQTKLYDCFAWDNGEFQFNPEVAPPQDPVPIGLTPAQLIHEGIKRTYDEKRLAKVFKISDAAYVHPSDQPLYALQDAGLNEEEQAVMSQVDGHKTVSTLHALDLLSPIETDKLLFAMKCAQMVDLKDKPADGKPKLSVAQLASQPARPPPMPDRPPPLPPRGSPPPLPMPVRGAISSGVGAAAAPVATASPAKPAFELPWQDAPVSERLQAEKPGPPVNPIDDLDALPKAQPKRKESQRAAMARTGSLLPELSAVTSGAKLTGEESILRERLLAKASAMRKLDYFEILGLPATASREDIKRAYFALAKEYHPDKHFSSSSAEVRQLAQQIYDLISTAHDTLSDATERERYVKDLAKGVKPQVGDEVGKILAAEGKFQKGEEMMRQRNFPVAFALFTEAIGLYPDEGEFHAWLGWSQFQIDPKNASAVEQSIHSIEHAIELNPKVDKSYLFLGYIHKATGRPDKAEKQFEKAIQANPDCTEALRELRLLGKGKR